MTHPLFKLDLGKSVAEFDEELQDYFVETPVFHNIVMDKGDVISGDKGTGKSALYKRLAKGYRSIPELAKVELLPAFNVSGNPVFQRLTEDRPPLTEAQYITIWKAYVVSLVGNWALQLFENNPSASSKKLENLLLAIGLKNVDVQPTTIFSGLINLFRRTVNAKSLGAEFSLGESGIPIVSPKIELGTLEVDSAGKAVRHEAALSLLNDVLGELGITVWVALDRLDEAFQGHVDTEIPALRALFRAYLDLQAYSKIRLKIFVRNDLFRRITVGGFVNLSHVNARRIEITWNDDDLWSLLFSRIKKNQQFLNECALSTATEKEIFDFLFPEQVEKGERQRDTWGWLISRIRDGNDVKPPRNLIDLINKSKDAQLRKARADEAILKPPLFDSESIKRGQEAMSRDRVEDTLLAETGDWAKTINKFRDGKAEHNFVSISKLANVNDSQAKELIESLKEIGFLEEIGETYKIPMLYREGLDITQGKAF